MRISFHREIARPIKVSKLLDEMDQMVNDLAGDAFNIKIAIMLARAAKLIRERAQPGDEEI